MAPSIKIKIMQKTLMKLQKCISFIFSSVIIKPQDIQIENANRPKTHTKRKPQMAA